MKYALISVCTLGGSILAALLGGDTTQNSGLAVSVSSDRVETNEVRRVAMVTQDKVARVSQGIQPSPTPTPESDLEKRVAMLEGGFYDLKKEVAQNSRRLDDVDARLSGMDGKLDQILSAVANTPQVKAETKQKLVTKTEKRTKKILVEVCDEMGCRLVEQTVEYDVEADYLDGKLVEVREITPSPGPESPSPAPGDGVCDCGCGQVGCNCGGASGASVAGAMSVNGTFVAKNAGRGIIWFPRIRGQIQRRAQARASTGLLFPRAWWNR